MWWRLITITLAIASSAIASEYSFDFSDYAKKPFEYQGFIRTQNGVQFIRNSDEQTLFTKDELNFKFDYLKESLWLKLKFDGSIHYNKRESSIGEQQYSINEFYNTIGENISLSLGKKNLMWGKGYVYNPVAFFDTAKDPLNPEDGRAGYWLTDFQYIRSFNQGALSNTALQLVYLPTDGSTINQSFGQTTASHNFALKWYLLFYDIDIDLIVMQNSNDIDGYGADFAVNLNSAIAIHGEYARNSNHNESYLLGTKIATYYDLTLTLERYRMWQGYDVNYMRLVQKEPLNIPYSTIYASWLNDTTRQQTTITTGATYDFKNGFTLDIGGNRTERHHGLKIDIRYYF